MRISDWSSDVCSSDLDHRNRLSAGDTPNEIASDSESSSAPNLLPPVSIRATRPSSPSSTPATSTISTARSHSPPTAKRMPLSPKHKASAVTALGATARNGRPRRSLGRLSLTISCQSLGDAGRRLSADAAEYRLAGDAALAEHDLARRVIRQIEVDAATEPDEAITLPYPHESPATGFWAGE